MHVIRSLAILSISALAAACAGPGTLQAANAPTGMAPMTAETHASMAAREPRVKAMHEMREKMAKAATPAEREALMAEHMKAMQGGMAMMKEMHAKHGAGMGMGMMNAPSGGAPMAGMGEGKGMPADMAKRHQMMTEHMAVMQMVMDMMAERMPPAAKGP